MLGWLSKSLVELEGPEWDEREDEPQNIVSHHKLALGHTQICSSKQSVRNPLVVCAQSRRLKHLSVEMQTVLFSVRLVYVLYFGFRDFSEQLSCVEKVLFHEPFVKENGVSP